VPGLRVCSPMTPREYEQVWQDFMTHDDPVYCSEHRASFKNPSEFESTCHPADVTLIGVSAARFNLAEAAAILAAQGITCNTAHVMWLKPLDCEAAVRALRHSRMGTVVDPAFETCGAAQSIAYTLMHETGRPVKVLGLLDRSVGVSPASTNPTPSAQRIADTVVETWSAHQARQPAEKVLSRL
jgi:pyruvate/2-oxoglutarate/acetoin dehydrogenase E1 component